MTVIHPDATRRGFLVSAGLGFVSLPASLYSGAFARGPDTPAERIRVGCVGVGGMGMTHVEKFAPNVVAVCDVDTNHLGKAKERVEKGGGKCATFGDYRKLLESKDIDAVVVATPDHWHALVTIEACLAGKDVYCEKPLTLTVAEGRAIVTAARKHKRIVQTGSHHRSIAKGRLAVELVRSGRVGTVHTVKTGVYGATGRLDRGPDADPPPELDYEFWLGPAPKRPYNKSRVHYNFRFFWDYSGGQLTNWGAHYLDIAQWALDMDDTGPVEVEGKGRYHDDGRFEAPSWYELTYKYANGVKLLCGPDHKIGNTFIGDKGSIHLDQGKLSADPPELLAPLADKDDKLEAIDDHRANWLACIKSRKLPLCDAEIGHRSATVCHLGNIAIRTGRKLVWDPKAETIADDKEAAAMLTKEYRKPWKLPTV